MNENDDLRRLFDEATSDVRPQGTYDDILNRTEKVDPMARRWFLPSLAAAAVMALVIGGAFWMTRDTDKPAGAAGRPSVTATATDDPTTAPEPTSKQATVFYVGDGARGPRLFKETHQVSVVEHTQPVAAVNEAMTGTPVDGDYQTYWPAGVTADRITFDGDLIGIRLTGDGAAERPASATAAQATAQVEAIVRTAEAAMGQDKAGVEFYVDDAKLGSVLGVDGVSNGSPSHPPTVFYPGSDDDVLALVQITSPTNNEKIKSGEKFTVTGVANAFEANLNWELLVGGDAVVDSGVVTAAECCKLAPYHFDLTLEPGTYTLVVHDTDESGTGRPINRDTKEIVVE